MVSSRDLLLRLRGDVSSLKAASGDASEALSKLSGASGFGGLTASVGAGIAAYAGGVAGIQLFSDALHGIVSAASEAEDAQVRLGAILRAQGNDSNLAKQQLLGFATEMQHLTGVSDETVQGLESVLIGISGFNENTTHATRTALDLSAALGIDAKSAATALGKALESPAVGMTSLQRLGVRLDDSQKALIKSMTDAGNAAGAQAQLLKVLDDRVGGVSAQLGQTASGSLARFRQGVNDLQEIMGGALLSAFDDDLKRLATWAESDDARAFTQGLASDMRDLAVAAGQVAVGIGHATEAVDTLRKMGAFGGIAQLPNQLADATKSLGDIQNFIGNTFASQATKDAVAAMRARANASAFPIGGGMSEAETGTGGWTRTPSLQEQIAAASANALASSANFSNLSAAEQQKRLADQFKAQAELAASANNTADALAKAAGGGGGLATAMDDLGARMKEAFDITELRNNQLASKLLEEAQLDAAAAAKALADSQRALTAANQQAVGLFGSTLGASPNFKGFANAQVAQEFIDNVNRATGGNLIGGSPVTERTIDVQLVGADIMGVP